MEMLYTTLSIVQMHGSDFWHTRWFDEYFLWVCRYVERNPLRAKFVKKAENWKWGSAWKRIHGTADSRKLLDVWPVKQPKDYLDWLNEEEEDETILAKLRTSINRGQPFGNQSWSDRMIKKFGLRSTVRPRGRPRKGAWHLKWMNVNEMNEMWHPKWHLKPRPFIQRNCKQRG